MNYIDDAVEYLKNYENLQRALENLEMDIRELKAEINAGQLNAVQYSDMPKGNGPLLQDDKLINKMYKLQVKKKEYIITKKTIEKMDKAIANLPEVEQKILRAWYIDGLRDETAYKHTGCSERNFYRCKNQALKTFSIQLHGISAI